MKVKELIEKLSSMDQEHEVVLASDCFKESFSELEEVEEGIYTKEDAAYSADFSAEKEDNENFNAVALIPVS